MHKYCY